MKFFSTSNFTLLYNITIQTLFTNHINTLMWHNYVSFWMCLLQFNACFRLLRLHLFRTDGNQFYMYLNMFVYLCMYNYNYACNLGAYSKAVTGLNTNSVKNFKLVDNCWHGAEAYHFLMLSQRQLIKGKKPYILVCFKIIDFWLLLFFFFAIWWLLFYKLLSYQDSIIQRTFKTLVTIPT